MSGRDASSSSSSSGGKGSISSGSGSGSEEGRIIKWDKEGGGSSSSKKSMHEQKDGDSGDDAVDSDGFPRWMLESAIGSSSKAVSKLRHQTAEESGYLVTEEEIPLPGYSLYYSEHYPNPSTKTKSVDTEGESRKRPKLLSPSRTNRRSERISDQIPLSQDPGWLQEDDDFDEYHPAGTIGDPFIIDELAHSEGAYDLDDKSSNYSGSQESSSKSISKHHSVKGSIGKSLGTTGRQSFRGDDSGKIYDALGTKIDQDTVIMMWGLDDLRRMDQQALCKAVFEYKAKVSIKKMKSIAHELTGASNERPSTRFHCCQIKAKMSMKLLTTLVIRTSLQAMML